MSDGSIHFVGVGAPNDALAAEREIRRLRIEEVRRIKDCRAREAAQRVNRVLATLGVPRRQRP